MDCFVVAQNGANIVQGRFFAGDGYKPPVAISGRHLGDEDWGGLVVRVSRCACRQRNNSSQCCDCGQQTSSSFHIGFSFNSVVSEQCLLIFRL
jgi:hypothetical protein